MKTVPVGAAEPDVPGGKGIVTTKLWGTPAASYSVESPVPLSETHQGVALPRDKPHAFTRFASVFGAVADVAETSAVKSVRTKCCADAVNVQAANKHEIAKLFLIETRDNISTFQSRESRSGETRALHFPKTDEA